jgi:hypothetical protein
MSDPELPNSDPGVGENFFGGQHGQEGQPVDHLEAELSKYQLLAQEARADGNEELADRLDAHVGQLADQKVEHSVAFFLEDARKRVQELASKQSGYASLYSGPPGRAITDSVLPKLRHMMLGREELPVGPEHMQDGSRRYVVPVQNNSWYVERYESPREGHDDEWVDVELFKDKSV